MLLGNYFHNINKDYKNFYFSGISFNTKSLKKNNIFFAIKGNKIDGNKFISNALKKGSYKGTPFNTAGWTSVEVAGKIMEKIGPILATKYMEVK